MHNPAHPGAVLREWLPDGMTVTRAAKELQVSRVTLSRVLNGKAGVTAEVALRLAAWLGTSPDVWLGGTCGKLSNSQARISSRWKDWLPEQVALSGQVIFNRCQHTDELTCDFAYYTVTVGDVHVPAGVSLQRLVG